MKTVINNESSPNSLSISLQHWLLGLVLCCGGALVWVLLLSYAGEFLTWYFNRGNAFETRSVSLRENGEPMVAITRFRYGGRENSVEHQTVDGKPLVLEPHELNQQRNHWQSSLFTNGFYYGHPFQYPNHLWIDAREPLPWRSRLLTFIEGNWQGVGSRQWFFRWPDRAGGSGFFEGFDFKTRHRIGYIGMDGFSETEPPVAEQFPAWDRNKSDAAAFVTAGGINSFPPVVTAIVLSEPGERMEYGLWFVTPKRDRLFVINLTRRSIVATRVLTGKLLGTGNQEQTRGDSQPYLSVPHRNPKLALLWEDHFEVVSPTLQTVREIYFPKELHGKVYSLAELPSGEFEDSYTDRSLDPRVIPVEEHFIRFNDRGETTLRKTVAIPRTPSSGYWSADPYLPPLSLMPITVAKWLVEDYSMSSLQGGGQPFRRPGEPLTWSIRLQALRVFIGLIGWPFWLTLLSGLPFAALCAWRQRTLPVSNFDRLAWPLLLSVFGIVGWVAFRTHRTKESRIERRTLAQSF